MTNKCPVYRHAVKDALYIFGPKSTRMGGGVYVDLEAITHIPPIVLECHKM